MDFPEFLKSLIRSLIDGLRRNKLPAILSLLTLILTTALGFTSEFDERPRYRVLILPKIQKAEEQFYTLMREAEQEPNAKWRLQYFLEAHRRAKMVRRVVMDEHPMTPRGRRAQSELLRYYDLVDEHLAIIRTEMSLNESYDYIGEWMRRREELKQIRERWVSWVNAP